MTGKQILGIVLLVVGIILLYFGYEATQSAGEQIHETFTGRFTETTTWYLVLGVAAAIGGVAMLISRR